MDPATVERLQALQMVSSLGASELQSHLQHLPSLLFLSISRASFHLLSLPSSTLRCFFVADNQYLQADLGTARREYISTADNKYYDGIRLEDIEAARLSNVQGSEARRLAEANKERLTEWSSK